MSSPLEEAFRAHVTRKRGIALSEQWQSDIGHCAQFESFKAGVEYALQNALADLAPTTRCCPRCKTSFYGRSMYCTFKCYVEDEGYGE